MRITLHLLICDREAGLGYCCEWLFFRKYGRTAQIAERLGVSTRAVKYHKAAAKQGVCPGRENCMKKKVL